MRVLLLCLLASVLAGCGIKGDLATPAPLWGGSEAEATAATPTEATASETVDTSEAPEAPEADDDVFEDEAPDYGIDVVD